MSMKPKYPEEIIPYPNYKNRMDVDELLNKYSKLLVVRVVEGHPEDFCISTQKGELELSPDVFKNNMANLSLNLAGGLFNIDSNVHLRFLPATKEASEIWNSNNVPVELYASEECYHFYEKCFGLCFFVCDIHNRTFPFYKHFETQRDRDNYEMAVKTARTELANNYDAQFVGAFVDKRTSVLVNPLIRVHHVPTMVNYWHMTLDTYRPTDSDYIEATDKQSSSDRRMLKALKQDLLQCCHININPDYSIEKCDYIV